MLRGRYLVSGLSTGGDLGGKRFYLRRHYVWQMELVFKKMKQLLRLNQIRSTHRTSVEATVRALLVAWALHEGTTTRLRTLLSAPTPPALAVVSSWLLSGLGLDTLRQQVHGTWSEA